MKIRNRTILVIGFFLLLCSCFTASAERINDKTGDVYHRSQSGAAWLWNTNISDRRDIDITEIAYSLDEAKLKLKLTVAGTIQDSAYYWYNAYFNTSDTVYTWWWSNGSGVSMAYNQAQQKYDIPQNFSLIGNNSISVEFNVLGNISIVEVWGQAHQYTTIGPSQQINEWWGDWAPNSKFTGEIIDNDSNTNATNGGTNGTTDGGNGNTSKPSTPGFEMLAVIIAVAVALILLRKHR